MNFNGSIDDGERRSGYVYGIDWMDAYWGGLFGEYAGFHAKDDGPWPGNGTPSDPIDVHVQFAGDSETKTITVQNVEPQVVTNATLSYESLFGDTFARVSVGFYDPGLEDSFTASVTWGDGVVSQSNINSFAGSVSGLRTVVVSRQINSSETLIPLKIEVLDDDLGEGERTLTKLEVAVNNDDDNQNNIEDLFDSGFEDDDLKVISLDSLKTDEMYPSQGVFTMYYGIGTVRLWTSSSKTTLILPSGYYSGESDYLAGIDTVPYSNQSTAWVEGISPGTTSITVGWIPGEQSLLYGILDEVYGNSINVGVWGIDLDIDSDNDNGFDFPDNSQWEEYLEDSQYGIGKMIEPNASHFVPMRLRLPAGLNPNDPQIRVQFDMDIVGKSGIVHAWNTFKADPARMNATIADGGNRVMPDVNYSLANLRYNPVDGGITIFLDAFDAFSGHSTKKGVDDLGKPDDRIKAIVLLTGLSLDDEVKYMAVDPDTFYPNLQANSVIRNSLASTGAYAEHENGDLPQFTLKKLSRRDMRKLGIPDAIVDLIGSPRNVPGFRCALYLDHVSGKYILAFAGTNDVQDVLVDIWQARGGFTEQYNAAMKIADTLQFVPHFNGNLLFTGHSLGGGLASAASVVTGIRADTFNAAGLLEETLLARDESGQPMSGVPIYVNSLTNYSNAALMINAYYLDWDLLSFIQDKTNLQNAIGTRIEMDGPLDLQLGALPIILAGQLASGVGWAAVFANLGVSGLLMGKCHVAYYYQYGLMVHEPTNWDIYGYDDF